jgi:hypothetical protein
VKSESCAVRFRNRILDVEVSRNVCEVQEHFQLG